MSFKFGLFRVLTSINMFLAGFFCLGLLSTYMGTRNFMVLVLLLLAGAVLIHTWLSLRLQRAIINPEYPMGENTPGGIRIMGGFSILYAFIYLCLGAAMVLIGYAMPDAALKDGIKESAVQLKDMGLDSLDQFKLLMRGWGPGMLLYGLSVLVNVILSLSFLQTIKYRQEQRTDDENRFEN